MGSKNVEDIDMKHLKMLLNPDNIWAIMAIAIVFVLIIDMMRGALPMLAPQ